MKKWSYDLPHISPKQKEIIELIYKFRFIDRAQIQTILNHKDHKRINVWLKDLVAKRYLFRIYERKIPFNIRPAIYYLAQNGVRDVGNHNLYREKYRSEKFKNRSLLIVNLYIDLLQKTRSLEALNFFQTKQNMWQYEKIIKPYPDVVFSLNKEPLDILEYLNKKKKLKPKRKGKKDILFFLEIIEEGVPRYYLRYRVKKYIEYYDMDKSATRPTILFSLPNEQTKKFMHRFIRKTLDETLFEPNIKFYLTLTDWLQNKGILGEIWQRVKELFVK